MVRSFALSVENNGKSNFELDGQRCEAARAKRPKTSSAARNRSAQSTLKSNARAASHRLGLSRN
jgi:hypothetical protein